MTKITVKQFVTGEYNLTEIAINDMMRKHANSHTKKTATIPVDATHQIVVKGSDLKFAHNGDLIGGTITSVSYLESGVLALTATGLSLNAAKARTAYNHHEDYPISSKPVFNFKAAPVAAPGADNHGVDFHSDSGNDKLAGSAFNDYLGGLSGNNTLKGLAGDDWLDGGADKDKLLGGAGNDSLFGSLGNDTIDGGDGRDWYYGPHSSSMGTSTSQKIDLKKGTATGFGSDKLVNIENAQGAEGNDKFKGNDADNTFQGNGGNDSLDGGGGSDKLFGDRGVDTLKGGSGADYFVFGAPVTADADHVKDFTPGEDKIVQLLPQTTSLVEGPISAGNFVAGTAAVDGDDFFIYDQSTGRLYFDKDGAGGAGQELIAILDNKAALQASDIEFRSLWIHPDFLG